VQGFYFHSCDTLMLKTSQGVVGIMLFPIGHLNQKLTKIIIYRYVVKLIYSTRIFLFKLSDLEFNTRITLLVFATHRPVLSPWLGCTFQWSKWSVFTIFVIFF